MQWNMVHQNSRSRTSIEIVTFSIAFSIVKIVAVEYGLIKIVTKIVTSRISPQHTYWIPITFTLYNRTADPHSIELMIDVV
jgi:hypothetical protein